jgi:hypothetical protein
MTREHLALPSIELVYDQDCPNVDRARAAIRQALVALGAPLTWREWDCAADATPVSLRVLGSPTILVNGRDVACADSAELQPDASSCRIYRDDCGCVCGAPSVELILGALTTAVATQEST